jgi:hypothetical protein
LTSFRFGSTVSSVRVDDKEESVLLAQGHNAPPPSPSRIGCTTRSNAFSTALTKRSEPSTQRNAKKSAHVKPSHPPPPPTACVRDGHVLHRSAKARKEVAPAIQNAPIHEHALKESESVISHPPHLFAGGEKEGAVGGEGEGGERLRVPVHVVARRGCRDGTDWGGVA